MVRLVVADRWKRLTNSAHTGTPGDYNRWKELGNEGWGYEDVEPYFVKSENSRAHPASQYRGKNGERPCSAKSQR